MFFFFFQAEDGIRDADVTGVQTCALPISSGEDLSVAPGVVHVSRGEVALLPCLHVGRGVACADVAGGWISGSSAGFTSSTTATMPYAATGLRVGWEQPLAGWLAVQAYLEG